MSIANDIAAMYRRPGEIMAQKLKSGPREDLAIAYVLGACALMFLAQLPRLSREAHLQGGDLDMMIGGALMGWIFIGPLLFYVIAWISALVMRPFLGAGRGSWGNRMSLFWALLSAAPLFLLLGLVQGFIGPGLQATVIGMIWLAAFLLFWFIGLRLVAGKQAV